MNESGVSLLKLFQIAISCSIAITAITAHWDFPQWGGTSRENKQIIFLGHLKQISYEDTTIIKTNSLSCTQGHNVLKTVLSAQRLATKTFKQKSLKMLYALRYLIKATTQIADWSTGFHGIFCGFPQRQVVTRVFSSFCSHVLCHSVNKTITVVNECYAYT